MKFLVLLAALSGAAALSGPDQVNGLLRESVTIQCRYGSYKADYKDRVKYWCKGLTQTFCDTVVKTNGLQTNDRISISDNKTEGVFTVTMRDLREEDEGWYWCGIKRTGYDEGTSVYLTVNKGTLKPTAKTTTTTTTPTTTPTATTPTPTTEITAPATSTAVMTSSSPGPTGHTTPQDASNLLIILSVVCGCLLFLCVLCLIIRMKINRDKQKGAIRSSTPPSVTYTTVRFQNNAQTPAGDGIYANVNPSQRQTEAPQRSESVEYSVLAF